ncbi:MAG: porin family protein [Dysgonomonas sp.]
MKINFKSCLVAVALLASVSSFAQGAGAVKFGVNAGVNLSNIAGDIDNTDAKIGFQAGVTADYYLTEAVFLQSGLSYTTKGYKTGDDDSGVKGTLGYLQLPIKVGYAIPVSDGFSVNLNAGPYLAYGISGKTKTTLLGKEISKVDSFNDGTNKFDFGIGGGVGAEFGAIAVNLHYEYGLSNYTKTDNVSIHNTNAYLTLGYKF